MSPLVIKNISIGLLLNFLFTAELFSQESGRDKVRLMFYNTENLFDTVDDTLKEDDEFLPEGSRRWNLKRYNSKINALYKTIVAAGGWQPPAVVAMCEIEKRSVLEDLVHDTFLMKYNYGIVHEESPDPRGIDVCMIYDRNVVSLLDYCYWIPEIESAGTFSSRSILYARLLIKSDTLHLIVNHWPSRRGGVLAGEGTRLKLAKLIMEKTDSINRQSNSEAKIIITGDFNCTPGDQELMPLTDPGDNSSKFVDFSAKPAEEGEGTYRYMGTWEMIDHVIVSRPLIKSVSGLSTDQSGFQVFKPDFLLKRDPVYPGFSPFSTYRGYTYQAGFSDHLPVLLDLGFN
jgi:hypothetical protein